MGDAAVTYGFYSQDSGDPNKPGYGDSSESLAIADKYGESWIFHVLTGTVLHISKNFTACDRNRMVGPNNGSAVWASQRVPDGHVAAVANFFTIRHMNLSDTDNFLASSNVESFAQEMKWWDPAQGPFDFTAAYGYNAPGPTDPLYGGRRMWRIYDWFAPSLHLDATLGCYPGVATYPFSVKVDTPVTLESTMELMKDHYEGTPYDMTKGMSAGPFHAPVRYDGSNQNVTGGWERPICMFRTLFSYVLQVHGTAPDVYTR
jgi:dipeptidase